MDRRCEDFNTKPGVHYHAHDLPACREPAAVVMADGRWVCQRHFEVRQRPFLRTGRKVGRTIYAQVGQASDDDELVGVMDTRELAVLVVESFNAETRRMRTGS